jgi:hypothetical protein
MQRYNVDYFGRLGCNLVNPKRLRPEGVFLLLHGRLRCDAAARYTRHASQSLLIVEVLIDGTTNFDTVYGNRGLLH